MRYDRVCKIVNLVFEQYTFTHTQESGKLVIFNGRLLKNVQSRLKHSCDRHTRRKTQFKDKY